ncbi:MAG: hypothetical protein COA71_04065 [SAR86 cluster bacterium]|uniref:Uncharacterized protein n=1 Tax=SAR86 cluster bacterium TaxID=2030880 RepID=A0A2A5CFP8_9GAMM|nr:MAG: hypothetical protein COA71_04065 [SAR86 cluster bacterium]
MKKIILTVGTIIVVSFLAMTQSVTAHHSFAMFDVSKEQIVIGRVIRWAFNNPHTWLYIEVEDEDGNTQTWGFEGAAQIHAMRQGVNGTTFQPGEIVKVVMLPLSSGDPAGAMCFVQKEDGSIVRPNDGVCDSDARAAVWQENGWLDSDNLTIFEKEPEFM